ncbi:MAG: hypothetical protein A3J09_01920 [Candidatus Zambryskibacteria bacterium RIFCSPLOWO2_02_FULL_51_21]|uniref:SCP domain-containing protein n=1 Tax=Candidatus Zambryskibacteria bacterium RIFCSPHIGHO2_02_FULL_43_37 TaxID=1802749 RepID=A0A1G2TGM8_9BACT|nr:MAG: hypothetical protein A2723_01920 [Candidatus Zambryskibacteria bacterium RIFCSPHIGHO2_01_FULL_52_18]OHA96447.1 MAG: hypothetical protein A3D49_00980 [Candidatus Zambryskibacteria bacterium RIFCSPHIGHO2_02_FULL_43_37]OHB06658.1 MAG: hypothetical protein A2944_00680 [Candidatus Zambryskibacteria bacterium RIFCSPLOWO2_01_FULL_52_12]OHB11292.1 MAG: hypothetical protein A3J09_01920 [Candidatus Zambryskibacteria bacterium RIFCSPLOWO2_02_FULL_51_21]
MPILILLFLISATLFGKSPEAPITLTQELETKTMIVEESVPLPFSPPVLERDAAAEAEIFKLVNEARREAGFKELLWDEGLSAAARAHSYDMWQRRYFAHEDPDGENPVDRLKEEGIVFEKAGENLALARSVARAHEGLMDSPGHRRNILDPDFRRTGIGVVDGGMYGIMVTEDFAD